MPSEVNSSTVRAALYARVSTDLQSAASIDDQLRMCQERAAKEVWQVVERYFDQAISGASLIRPGIQKLLQDAAAGKFEIILTESLDRVSRDQEDIAHIYKRMRFKGVRIVTLSDGDVNELHIGLKGTMGALYLKDLGEKTRRGLRGRIEAGKSGGGNSYGYDVVKKIDDSGEPSAASAGSTCSRPRSSSASRRLRPGRLTPGDRQAAEPGGRGQPLGQRLGPEHDPRQLAARHRHPEQRALHRQAGVEPAPVRQGPADREADLEAQSPIRMDHRRRARTADHRPGPVGPGQGTAGGAARQPLTRQQTRLLGSATPEVPVHGPDAVRCMWWRRRDLESRAHRMRERPEQGHLHE